MTKQHSFLLFIIAIIGVSSPAVKGNEPIIEVGVALRDITPEPGVSMNGSIARGGLVKGVQDPLSVRAMVLSDGDSRIAIAIVDACYLGNPLFREAHSLVRAKTGIPASHQIIAATHTHTGPRTLAISRRSKRDDEWHAEIARQIAAAVDEAAGSMESARLSFGSIPLPELVKNRRYFIDPATPTTNPYGENHETVGSVFVGNAKRLGPAGPTDPDFRYLLAKRADGSPVACLGNFGVHYCGGYERGKVSADYFGAFCRHLESRVKSNSDRPFLALHSNGTSGDIGTLLTPAELKREKIAATERCNRIGAWIAETIHDSFHRAEPLSGSALFAIRKELTLPVRRPNTARLAWAREIVAGTRSKPLAVSRQFAEEAIHLADYPDKITLPISVIGIGPLRIAASPCETFAETGLALLAARKGEPTFTIELANGYGGYLPTEEAHRHGGYETWEARSSFLGESSESQIRESLIELLTTSFPQP